MTSAPTQVFDVAIAGGGFAGTTLACALDQLGLKVLLIEAHPVDMQAPPTFDDRAIALSYGSQRIFAALGLWQAMSPTATPIQHIHISEQGRFGQTHLTAAEEGVDALGYVALARNLGQTLYAALEKTAVTRLCPATLVDFTAAADSVDLIIEQDSQRSLLTARLLVGADGTQSGIRQLLNIESAQQHYGQTAIVTNALPSQAHHNIAYERFTPAGPLALLPMSENRFGIVLTVAPAEQEQYLAMTDANFIEELHRRIGFRVGRFSKVGKRRSYPLLLMQADSCIGTRVALIGNAAHALHPISGQGFNLGLRDIALLVDLLADALRTQTDIGSQTLLQDYADGRHDDVRSMTRFTDSLAWLFSNPLQTVGVLRSTGLFLTDLLPGLRSRIARHSMGLRGRQARLSLGLPPKL